MSRRLHFAELPFRIPAVRSRSANSRKSSGRGTRRGFWQALGTAGALVFNRGVQCLGLFQCAVSLVRNTVPLFVVVLGPLVGNYRHHDVAIQPLHCSPPWFWTSGRAWSIDLTARYGIFMDVSLHSVQRPF